MSTFLMNQLAKRPRKKSDKETICQPCFLLDHMDEGEAKRWSECHFIHFLAIYIFHK